MMDTTSSSSSMPPPTTHDGGGGGGGGGDDDYGEALPRLSQVYYMTREAYVAAVESAALDGMVPIMPPIRSPFPTLQPSQITVQVSSGGRTRMGLKTNTKEYAMSSLLSWSTPGVALRKFGYEDVGAFHDGDGLHGCMYYFLCRWPADTDAHMWEALGVRCDLRVDTNVFSGKHPSAGK